MENFDETHSAIDKDDGRVLDIKVRKDSPMLFASAWDCFTVCMRISSGEHGKIVNPLVIFQHPNSKEILDNILTSN